MQTAAIVREQDPLPGGTNPPENPNYFCMEWNAENQLIRVTKDTAEVARYAYDPARRRVEKVVAGVTTSYTYDNEDVLRETRSDGTLYTFVHGPSIDVPLSQNSLSSTNYYHADAIGSIVGVTNSAGMVAYGYSYDPWGNIQSTEGISGFAFTGREWDAESVFYFYRHRYYDPKAARFIGEDPLPLLSGNNLYSYVLNKPTNFTDPLGEFCVPSLSSEGLAVFGYYGKKSFEEFKNEHKWTRDRERHCWAACMTQRRVPCNIWPQNIIVLTGLHQAFTRGFSDSAADTFSHYYGEFAALIFWKTCRELCEICPFNRKPGEG